MCLLPSLKTSPSHKIITKYPAMTHNWLRTRSPVVAARGVAAISEDSPVESLGRLRAHATV
jgi:hypothetical protein